jgi:hypothetical protein
MALRGRNGVGCLGSIVGLVVVVAIVAGVVFAGLIALGVVAAVVIIGLVVIAIDRVLLAISPKRRERRANLQRSFMIWGPGAPGAPGPPGPVIDSTAHLADPHRDQPPEEPAE